MKTFLNKIKNNKADVEPLFFLYGIMIIMFLLWFALDIINMSWSRYTIRREAQNVARLYSLTWINSIWDPTCEDAVASNCEYGSTTESKLSEDFEKITRSAMQNGGFSKLTIMITTDTTDTLNDCSNSLFCIKGEGNSIRSYGWPIQTVKENLEYGTDLYMIVEGVVPYKFVGEKLGLEDNVYTVTNKFASERFGRNDGAMGGIV